MTYTLQLVSLICLKAQEDDGDEVNFFINQKRVWSWRSEMRRMHHAMTKRGSTCTDQLDFVNARMQIGTQVDLTWIPMVVATKADFRLEGLEAAAEIGFTEEDLALWDMQDDVLGAVHVIDFTPGERNHRFKWKKSVYELSYRIE